MRELQDEIEGDCPLEEAPFQERVRLEAGRVGPLRRGPEKGVFWPADPFPRLPSPLEVETHERGNQSEVA